MSHETNRWSRFAIRAYLCAGIALVADALAPNASTPQTSPFHGTLIVALVTDTDMALAADSLEINYSGGIWRSRFGCKISLLSRDTAVALSGIEDRVVPQALAARMPKGGESLQATSDRWVRIFEKYLHRTSYPPEEDEYKIGIDDGIFATAGHRSTHVEQTRVYPVTSPQASSSSHRVSRAGLWAST